MPIEKVRPAAVTADMLGPAPVTFAGTRVVPGTATPDGPTITIWPLMVSVLVGAPDPILYVEPSMMAELAPTLSVKLPAVTGVGAPGAIDDPSAAMGMVVEGPMISLPLTVNVWPLATTTDEDPDGGIETCCPPIATLEPLAGTTTGTPLTLVLVGKGARAAPCALVRPPPETPLPPWSILVVGAGGACPFPPPPTGEEGPGGEPLPPPLLPPLPALLVVPPLPPPPGLCGTDTGGVLCGTGTRVLLCCTGTGELLVSCGVGEGVGAACEVDGDGMWKSGGAVERGPGMMVGIGVFLVTKTVLVYRVSPVSVGTFSAQPAPTQPVEGNKVAEQGGGGVMKVASGRDWLLAVREI